MRQYNVNISQPEHKFWSIQEVISTSLLVDNTCGSTITVIIGQIRVPMCNCGQYLIHEIMCVQDVCLRKYLPILESQERRDVDPNVVLMLGQCRRQ